MNSVQKVSFSFKASAKAAQWSVSRLMAELARFGDLEPHKVKRGRGGRRKRKALARARHIAAGGQS